MLINKDALRAWCLVLVWVGSASLLSADLSSAEDSTQGFLYGKVTMRSDSIYEGRLRWNGDEEAFWGDFFNATKDDRPYLDHVPDSVKRQRKDGEGIKVLGIRIAISSSSYESSRSLVARFGDLARIEVRRRNSATLVLKSGEKVEVDSGSNDLGGTILVWDSAAGEVKLDWDRIEVIEFLPTPSRLDVPVSRLHGKMQTSEGQFEGYIQWDQQECLSTDKLDGDTADGDMSIEMGNIRSIERLSKRAAQVTLWNGREYELDGTNDVNNDNRGIYIEDARFGRVLVSWNAFERLDFSKGGASGPAYEDFAPARELKGQVTDKSGQTHRGRLVYDIDEAQTWEMLNGDEGDLEYSIPFALVRSIEPRGDDASRVTLVGGEEVTLDDSADVGSGNDGVLVFPEGGGDPTYFEWKDIKKIEFQR